MEKPKNERIREIQYLCDEISQWTVIYFNIDDNNKIIKELGFEKLEAYYKRLKELL